jgi:hypothetical protein
LETHLKPTLLPPYINHLQVQVFTAASSPALTAGLFITPSGMYGSATEEQLVNDSADGTNLNLITFEPGSVQEFNLKVCRVIAHRPGYEPD